MPLNLSVGDGDFTPFMKYNAKAGRFYVRPDGATEETEIINPILAFDMANIKTGWLYYFGGLEVQKNFGTPRPHKWPQSHRDQKSSSEVLRSWYIAMASSLAQHRKIGLCGNWSSTAAKCH